MQCPLENRPSLGLGGLGLLRFGFQSLLDDVRGEGEVRLPWKEAGLWHFPAPCVQTSGQSRRLRVCFKELPAQAPKAPWAAAVIARRIQSLAETWPPSTQAHPLRCGPKARPQKAYLGLEGA